MASSRALAKYNLAAIKTIFLILVFFLMVMPSEAFLRHLCFNPLGISRVDPIVSPGEPAAHVHHIHGSSNIGLDSIDADYLLSANCTSCSITVDKSAYWTPAMYFQHADNGSFELMTTSSGVTIYYKLEKRENFEDQNYTVFPKGFKMIAGTTAKRTWVGPWPVPPQSFWGPNDTTQAAIAEKALGFNCLNYHAAAEPSLGFPYMRSKEYIDANCADGVRAEIIFPSCWDGVNLDSKDHKSHVAYPTLIQDGACPESHPIFLPILFFETIWDTQKFAGVPGQFVFANGDPTGFGYHADFIAAWKDDILQRMVDDPTCTDHDLEHRVTDGLQEKCNVVNKFIQTQDVAAKCKLELPEVIAQENVHFPDIGLPGGVKLTGKQHQPGGEEDIQPSSALSETASSAAITAPSVALPSVATASTSQTFNPLSSAMVTDASSARPTPDVILSTSIYTTDGTYVELIIAEEIVTTTVTANPAVTHVARHVHGQARHL